MSAFLFLLLVAPLIYLIVYLHVAIRLRKKQEELVRLQEAYIRRYNARARELLERHWRESRPHREPWEDDGP